MITAGIDIGSITSKAAIIENGKILGTKVSLTGYNAGDAAKKVFNDIISELGIERSQIKKIVATGYGRKIVDFADKAMTEIICHGKGAHFTAPEIRSIIDVGGQDSKAIIIDEEGRVKDFVMNDKCAAGTGRFLEVMAKALESDLNDFGKISVKAMEPAKISSICTVFAESEVISLISKGESRDNIIAGINESVAFRVAALAKRIGVKEPLMMTGGVAKNMGVVNALKAKLGMDISISSLSQENGAVGAAILAAQL